MRRLLLLLLLPVLSLQYGNPLASPPDRPNILWITVEDLSPRIGAYGDSIAETPNIDRLASEGVRYTRAFSVSGVCST